MDGNILYYGIISKREDDAIQERLEKLKREHDAKDDPENKPLMENEGGGGNNDNPNPANEDVV